MDLNQKSKYLSLLLRHHPEKGNVTVNRFGWAPIKEIVKALDCSYSDLQVIVQTDEKKRYSFNSDNTCIRANQGHSISVEVEMEEFIPEEGAVLYHGTADRFLKWILLNGLTSQKRLFVHMTDNIEVAEKTGARYGKPVVLRIDAYTLYTRGNEILKSSNGVYQTKNVPNDLISVVI